MYVADEAWSKVAAGSLASAGYVGVIGYCSYDGTGKNLPSVNIDAYHKAGLQVALVWETYGQAASGGFGVGQKEATDFVRQLKALGATGGTVWMCAEDPTREPVSDYPNIDAYFQAAAPIVTGAGFRLGIYGSEQYLKHAVATNGGITRQWFVGGWSQDVSPDITQQSNHPGASTFNGQVDCNYAPSADWGWTEFGGVVLIGVVTPTPPSGPPTISKGATGPVVQEMQEDLGITPADGLLGPGTEAAVKAFQAAHGLTADGIVGPNTWPLVEANNPAPPTAPVPPIPPVQPSGIAEDGAFGPATVRALQKAVGASQDGIYGDGTRRALQRHLGVPADGIVGPQTIRALQAHVGAAVDGIWGAGTTRALQHAINTGRF